MVLLSTSAAGPPAADQAEAEADARSLVQQGNALLDAGSGGAAVAAFRRAVELAPLFASAHLNLARAHLELGSYRRGVRAARRLVALRPASCHGHRMLGHLLARQGETAAARASWRAAVAARPGDVEAWRALARSLFGDATATRETATAVRIAEQLPGALAASSGSGAGASASGAELAERALFCGLRAVAQQRILDWRDVREAVHAVEERLGRKAEPGAPPLLDYAFVLVLPLSARLTLDVVSQWTRFAAREAAPAPAPPRGADLPSWDGRRRLRVGYVSSEFGSKPVGCLVQALFRHHDRRRVEVFAYSLAPDDGSREYALNSKAAEHWRELPKRGPLSQVGELIRRDNLDVLVEMLGWKLRHHAVISGLPARRTISFLAFPGTRGASYIQGLATDRVTSPPESASDYSEELVYQPYSYHVAHHDFDYTGQPLLSRAAVQAMPGFEWYRGLRSDDASAAAKIVTCSFNSEWKIEPPLLSAWAGALRRTGATLWQVIMTPHAVDNLRSELGARGVEPGALATTEKRSRRDHVAVASVCDLHLDTHSHNAHSTALDALWAGVPIVTLPGERFAARVAASMSIAVGVPEMVVHSLKEYEDTVAALGNRPGELARLKSRVAKARRSRLFDSKGWVSAWEETLRRAASES